MEKTTIPTQQEYEAREMRLHLAKINEVENQPLLDRRQARQDYTEAMKDFNLVAERISWLLGGNYGFGAMQTAKEVVDHPRMNQVTALSQLIAAYEWNCPAIFSRHAYNNLNEQEKQAVNAAIQEKIDEYLVELTQVKERE